MRLNRMQLIVAAGMSVATCAAQAQSLMRAPTTPVSTSPTGQTDENAELKVASYFFIEPPKAKTFQKHDQITIRLLALLLQRREQLPRGLELRFKTRAARERMLLRAAQRTRLTSLQIMPVLIKTSHQLRLSRHLALRFESLRESLQLGAIHFGLRSACSRFFR